LEWDEVGWEAFVAALGVYKRRFAGSAGQDLAYVRCLGALEGLSIRDRAARAEDIVKFLNSWAARVSRAETSVMLSAWIGQQADRLERLARLTIADERLTARVAEIEAVYGDLMTAGRSRVRNWSDAANSKALHQLVPAVFVMWDQKIKQFARDYGDFMQRMHRLARRLILDSPYSSANTIETELQIVLGYSSLKPLAKYLDEFNVVAVGASDPGAPDLPVS
jgi:hypothetical protein